MQAQNILAGQWYHTVGCVRCGATVYAFHARSGADERLPGPGMFAVRCSDCGYRDLYKPAVFSVRCAGETQPARAGAPAPIARRVARRQTSTPSAR